MANLTITIDDEVLKRARVRAVELGTSVNAVLRDYLEAYAGTNAARTRAVRMLLDLSSRSQSARGDQRWSRDDVHER